MKGNFAIVLTGLTLFAALAIPALLIAQEQSGLQPPQKHHTHYKVIDTGSLGGPNSHMTGGRTSLTTMGCSLATRTRSSQIRTHPMSVGIPIAGSHARLGGTMAN